MPPASPSASKEVVTAALHGDITADCVAKAFGVPIDADPRALAILHEWVKTTGAEMNEAPAHDAHPPGRGSLFLNKVLGALGFWIGNVDGEFWGVSVVEPPRSTTYYA